MELNRAPTSHFYQDILEYSPLPVFYKNTDGIYVWCNQAFFNYIGKKKEEVIGKTVFDLAPLYLAEQYYIKDQELFSKGGQQEYEWQIKDKNGEIRHVIFSKTLYYDDNNKVLGLYGSIHDITKRKQAEEKLQVLSEAVLQNPAAVIITNHHGNISYVNPKFETLTGYSKEEVIGKNPRILKSGEQPKEFYNELWNTISKGKEWKGAFKNINKNGSPYWAEATISAIINQNKEIEYYVGVQEDVTKRKELEEKLAQNLEHIRLLIRLLIHDIANPLTVIQGNAEKLKSSNPKHVDKINQSVTIISEIIENVKQMQGLETNKIKLQSKPVVLKEVLDDILFLFEDSLDQKGLDLIISYPHNYNLKVLADKSSLRDQVFSNLISNAIKFSYPNSKISIQINDLDKHVEIIIKDHGIGMSPELTHNIFKPYVKTTRPGTSGEKGTGFGMPLVKKYIEKYNGTINVTSTPEDPTNNKILSGTCFTLCLVKR